MTGPHIKDLRLSLGLSGTELGQVIGTSRAHIYMWENGDRCVSRGYTMLLDLLRRQATLWQTWGGELNDYGSLLLEHGIPATLEEYFNEAVSTT